jgi:hypothetical protein
MRGDTLCSQSKDLDRWNDDERQKHKSQKQAVLKMEFKKFRNNFIQLPCRIIRTGRKIVYRILSWNPWLAVFFRGFRGLRYSPGGCGDGLLQEFSAIRVYRHVLLLLDSLRMRL